mmetsp:Transcript_12866/g.43513  ORF Transcript_12866/g.43513 Transcript_12866/m.43513 type:complete len:233 (-) Transcript_12866:673-1371(-)
MPRPATSLATSRESLPPDRSRFPASPPHPTHSAAPSWAPSSTARGAEPRTSRMRTLPSMSAAANTCPSPRGLQLHWLTHARPQSSAARTTAALSAARRGSHTRTRPSAWLLASTPAPAPTTSTEVAALPLLNVVTASSRSASHTLTLPSHDAVTILRCEAHNPVMLCWWALVTRSASRTSTVAGAGAPAVRERFTAAAGAPWSPPSPPPSPGGPSSPPGIRHRHTTPAPSAE